MNWFKTAQAKPLPLPFPTDELVFDEPNSRGVGGLKYIDRIMSEETAKQQKEEFDPTYLGSGTAGLVVNLPGNKVGKYTRDRQEAEFAKKLIKNPLHCFVKVFEVREIQPKLWMIISEKVRPLTDEFEQVIALRLRSVSKYKNMQDTYEKEKQFINDMFTQDQSEPYLLFLEKHFQMMSCLQKNNIYTQEAHEYNLGYTDDGRLVILDLGGSHVHRL